jgi:hypothetical protein
MNKMLSRSIKRTSSTNSRYSFLSSIVLFLAIALLSVRAIAQGSLQCAVQCDQITLSNPCADGKAQQKQCSGTSSSVFKNMTNLGYESELVVPNGFLGCSAAACATKCAGMDETNLFESFPGTTNAFCFNATNKVGDNAMFMNSDLAGMHAIAQGCAGNHSMGNMYMGGSTHMACASSYSADGVAYTYTASSASSAKTATMVFASLLSLAFVL